MHKVTLVGAAAVLSGVFAVPAFAAGISVTGGWFRSLPEGLPAAGYFSLHNAGSAPAVLTGARSSACGMVMLHESSEEGGTSRMRDVQSVTVPAGGSVAFAPGGYHLMCMHPAATMMPGSTVRVTLQFAGGGTAEAPFAVRTATGK
ncbi:MAG TPA: copper chaperone PCu(A)C [Rhizomicrobium sp.]|jgi:hypothetical protein